MSGDLFGAALAFGVGFLLAAVDYAVARYTLKKKPSRYMTTQVVKQILQVVFLVLLYAFGGYTPWNRIWLLVGGGLGITLPMGFFTYRLVKLNDSLQGEEHPSDG